MKYRLASPLQNPIQMQGIIALRFNDLKEVLDMSHVHEEKGVEVIGVAPSVAMVLAGLVIAILPALVQVYLLAAG